MGGHSLIIIPMCCRWLDEGEDDGKIVRELRAQEEYVDDIMEKRNVRNYLFCIRRERERNVLFNDALNTF